MGVEKARKILAADMSNVVYNAFDRRLRDDNLETGGGGGHTGGMDAWQNSVETRLSRIDIDLRLLWKSFLGGVVVLAGMMITGYLMLDSRLGSIEKTVAVIQSEMTSIRRDVSDIRGDVSAILEKLTK